jgi:hypothetical protein
MKADQATVSRLLLWLALAFFIWLCLKSAGVSAPSWLLPGGLAAWVLSEILG